LFYEVHRKNVSEIENTQIIENFASQASIALHKIRIQVRFTENQEITNKIIDASPDAIILCDLNGIVTYASTKAIETFGCISHIEIIGTSIFDRIDKENIPTAQTTFGYITKVMRTQLGLAKSHANDAFVIAGGHDQQRPPTLKLWFKRKNNRSLQKQPIKGGKRSLRTQRYPIQPNDMIEYDGKIYRSKGTHCKGSRVTAFVGDKIVSLSIKKVMYISITKKV